MWRSFLGWAEVAGGARDDIMTVLIIETYGGPEITTGANVPINTEETANLQFTVLTRVTSADGE